MGRYLVETDDELRKAGFVPGVPFWRAPDSSYCLPPGMTYEFEPGERERLAGKPWKFKQEWNRAFHVPKEESKL